MYACCVLVEKGSSVQECHLPYFGLSGNHVFFSLSPLHTCNFLFISRRYLCVQCHLIFNTFCSVKDVCKIRSVQRNNAMGMVMMNYI